MNQQQLLTQHLTNVYRFALRLTQGDVHRAEDLAQEAILRAWEHRDELTHEKVAIVWLLRTVRRLWVDEGRRAGVRRVHARRVAEHRVMTQPRQQESKIRSPETDDEAQLALELMDQLPPRQREVLHLHACEGLRTDAIAQVLDISPRAVTASLSLARHAMTQRWQRQSASSERSSV